MNEPTAELHTLRRFITDLDESEWRPWCDKHNEPMLMEDSSIPRCWKFNWIQEQHNERATGAPERCVSGGRLVVDPDISGLAEYLGKRV